MANEIILQKHMNAEEKAHALKLFKQLLTEKTEILKDTRYTPAQTIEQSCFISGGFENEAGEFDAIFFPNSDFKGLKIVCLAFQNGKPCMVCHHEIKLQNGIKAWESVEILDNLIYEDEEMDEINNLKKKAINCYNEYISILEIFKRKRTKSGGNFKRLCETLQKLLDKITNTQREIAKEYNKHKSNILVNTYLTLNDAWKMLKKQYELTIEELVDLCKEIKEHE